MMADFNGEVQRARLTGLQSDQISPDFADAAHAGYKPIVALTRTSRVMKYRCAANVGLTCTLSYRLHHAKQKQPRFDCQCKRLIDLFAGRVLTSALLPNQVETQEGW